MSVQVDVLSTFQMDDGSYCRRFLETVRDSGNETEAPGIACKAADGGWVRL